MSTHPADCPDADALIASASSANNENDVVFQGHNSIEFNVPADTIMLVDMMAHSANLSNVACLSKTLSAAVKNAEAGMLQIAFLNKNLNPGCAWLTQAINAGWRYRIDKGFFKTTKGD